MTAFARVGVLIGLCLMMLAGRVVAQEYRRGKEKEEKEAKEEEQDQRREPEPEPAPAEPQTVEVTLRIVDKNTNDVLRNAKVKIEERNVNEMVGPDGEYTLTLKPEETVEVRVSADEYQRRTLKVGTDFDQLTLSLKPREKLADVSTREAGDLVTGPASEVTTDFQNFMDLEVVSATRTKQSLSEAPAIISVITADQIAARGYRSVGEAVNTLPGFDALNDLVAFNFGVRGVNGGLRSRSNLLKVLIDGQPVAYRPNQENWLGPELIPINLVERIEVIRGPNSAVYGANAFLGVISIITKSGEAMNGGFVQAEGIFLEGNPGGGGQITYGNRFGNLEVIGGITGFQIDRSGLSPQAIPSPELGAINVLPKPRAWQEDTALSENDLRRPMSVFSRVAYKSEETGNISLDVNYQELDSYGEFQDWSVLSHDNRVNLYNMTARLGYSKTFLENFSLNASGTYARGGTTDQDRLALNDSIVDYAERDYGYTGVDGALDISYTYLKLNNFKIGVDYSADNNLIQRFSQIQLNGDIVPIQNGPTNAEDTTFANLGVYAQGIAYPFQMTGADNSLNTLGATFGVRYDRHNIYENVFNYRFGLVYKPTPNIYGKLLYGSSFRAPTPAQLYTYPIDADNVRGNPDLDPERAQTLEFALGGVIAERLNVQVNAFTIQVQDKILYQYDATINSSEPQNISDIEVYGAELETNLKLPVGLTAYGNVSYQLNTVSSDDPALNLVQEPGEDPSTTLYPNLMGKFGLTYLHEPVFLSINLEGQYVGARTASPQNVVFYNEQTTSRIPYELDPYFLLNAFITSNGLKLWGERETKFGLGARNILNTDYAFPGFTSRAIDAAFAGQGTSRNHAYDIPGLGINFFLRVSQQF